MIEIVESSLICLKREIAYVIMALKALLVREVIDRLQSASYLSDPPLPLDVVSCDMKCNGHGICRTLSSLYDFYTPSGDGNYGKWDGEFFTQCVCDPGESSASTASLSSHFPPQDTPAQAVV